VTERGALRWECLPFDDLGPHRLHDALELRARVFVVEQACVFNDVDGLDPVAEHLFAWSDDRLAGYARLLPVGAAYPDAASIGRIVVPPARRGTGLGRDLVTRSIARLDETGAKKIVLNAQHALTDYYATFGFNATGKPYMLEINPNCGVFYPPTDPGSADLCLLNDPAGHEGFARQLVAAALARAGAASGR